MKNRYTTTPLSAVFLTRFEGLDLYAIEDEASGAFISYLVRKSPAEKRTRFPTCDPMDAGWSPIPKTWGLLADDLYSEYLDSRFREDVVS
jgi:hypothetical protein